MKVVRVHKVGGCGLTKKQKITLGVTGALMGLSGLAMGHEAYQDAQYMKHFPTPAPRQDSREVADSLERARRMAQRVRQIDEARQAAEERRRWSEKFYDAESW